MLSAVIPSERSQPAVLLAEQLAHQRFVRPGPLVLGTAFLKSPARAADRDRTVSRRSKPSSRTALMGEQPNPWDLLQPQDATSRHRGAKPSRRYGLLGKISLLSPGYLLSVERHRFHTHWRPSFTGSHLSYTITFGYQCQAIVKVPGSFRPAARNEHLYSYCNFAGPVVETVGKSLRHSCRSELTRQGISLP